MSTLIETKTTAPDGSESACALITIDDDANTFVLSGPKMTEGQVLFLNIDDLHSLQ